MTARTCRVLGMLPGLIALSVYLVVVSGPPAPTDVGTDQELVITYETGR
jgi:hypothetical protein